MESQTCSLS
uniref:Uncharacterized protein n=1 Tax=Arundo donax TaxID=35708 RepID=A0A0A9B5N7_ARUDO